MSVPTEAIERIEGPARTGSRKRPRWVLSLVVTDEGA